MHIWFSLVCFCFVFFFVFFTLDIHRVSTCQPVRLSLLPISPSQVSGPVVKKKQKSHDNKEALQEFPQRPSSLSMISLMIYSDHHGCSLRLALFLFWNILISIPTNRPTRRKGEEGGKSPWPQKPNKRKHATFRLHARCSRIRHVYT